MHENSACGYNFEQKHRETKVYPFLLCIVQSHMACLWESLYNLHSLWAMAFLVRLRDFEIRDWIVKFCGIETTDTALRNHLKTTTFNARKKKSRHQHEASIPAPSYLVVSLKIKAHPSMSHCSFLEKHSQRRKFRSPERCCGDSNFLSFYSTKHYLATNAHLAQRFS